MRPSKRTGAIAGLQPAETAPNAANAANGEGILAIRTCERLGSRQTTTTINQTEITMKRSFLLTLLAPVVAAGSLQAASADYLLEIDGIKGESSDNRHAQAIEIQSFSWGSTNSAASSGGGGGAGKVSFQDIHCTTKVSKAGPQLLLAGASTSHIPRATLTMRKAGTAAAEYQEYYRIQLEDVLISSYSQHGNSSAGDVVPTDQFTLNFNKVTIIYTGVDGTVTTGTAVRTPATTAPQ